MPATDTQPWRKTEPEELWPVYENFAVFLCMVWAFLNLPPPTPVQLDQANYLQYGPKRSITEAFRGVGKSWITSAYVCWLLLRNPQLNILVASASKERSDQFTTFTLRLISEMPILQHLYPRTDQRCSKIAFDVAPAEPDHAPSVKSVGIMGQMAGSRADVIIPDDVEVPNNSETPPMREKLSERVKEFDAILKPGGSIKYLGTPQTEESLYNKLRERGYSVRIWPARFPTAEQLPNYGETLAPKLAEKLAAHPELAGTPTDPRRFNVLDLMERELSYGRSGFALQFMLDTRLSDAERYPLKLSDLVVMDCDNTTAPEKIMWAGDSRLAYQDLPLVGFDGDRYYRPFDFTRDDAGNIRRRIYDTVVMSIDPAGRGKDETAYAVVGVLNSQMFLLDNGGFTDGYTAATLTALVAKAKQWQVKALILEPNFGDGMFEALLKPYLSRDYKCSIEEWRAVGQKETRIINTLEPVLNQHRLIVDRALIERDYKSVETYPQDVAKEYRLFYQLSRVTKDKGALRHDDRLDALCMAVAFLVEHMTTDADLKAAEHQAEAEQAELDRFMEHAIGGRAQSGSTWLDTYY